MNNSVLASAWEAVIVQFFPIFTEPTAGVFLRVVTGWVLCTGRRTVTGMYPFADPKGLRAHDAYHRFFSEARWRPSRLWKLLAKFLVKVFYPTGVVLVDLDDTLFHRSGRKVSGAGWWRDAVRSTGTKVVHAWGLNLVVLTLRVDPPWGGEPIGLPINLRLHRKNGSSLIDLAESMLGDLTRWFPERRFRACADGFYASLAGKNIPRVHLVSRIRSDAAIYQLPSKRKKGQRGRPPKKGPRLSGPRRGVKHIRSWQTVDTTERGKIRKRLVYARPVIWYHVWHQPILLVISRDPSGKERDDFFFTTDIHATPAHVIEAFAGRWSIEDTFKNTKQLLGVEHPQTWKGPGPERAAVMGLALYSLIWTWFLREGYRKSSLRIVPWYSVKSHPSFADALAALRRVLWRQRIISMFGKASVHYRISKYLLAALERAA